MRWLFGHLARLRVLVVVALAVAPVSAHAQAEATFTYPAADRVWDADDYLRLDAILRLSAPADFPSLRSSATSAVFRRIVDGANVARARDNRLPLLSRLIDLRVYDGFIGAYRARYNVAVRNGAGLGEELVELQVFLLDLCSLTVGLTEPFAASLDPTDGQRLASMRFFDTYSTLRNHLLGVIRSLREPGYTPDQRRRLAEAVSRHMDTLRLTLRPQDRPSVAADLRELAGEPQAASLAPALLAAAALAEASL